MWTQRGRNVQIEGKDRGRNGAGKWWEGKGKGNGRGRKWEEIEEMEEGLWKEK